MKLENPKVTLEDEARIGVEETVRSGFLDWLFECNVTGDDGELYAIGGSILSMHLEQLDLVTLNLSKGKGTVRQLPDSIYQRTDYPGCLMRKFYKNPKGTMQIERRPHSVLISCGQEFCVECFDDGRWHIGADTLDGEYRLDLWHCAHGYPLWYGRETPSHLTQHSITYGYNWAGDVDGVFSYQGKTVHFKGTGQRERYVAVDSSAAELGGWEDWGFLTFNELHSSFYDMRLGKKDLVVCDLEKGIYYPEGKLTIEHEDWAFLRELDGFIPTRYHICMETAGGIYEVCARVCNARTWGVTHHVPDYPVATLIFDQVEGTFTEATGAVRKLTGGRSTVSVRQWHAYPNILPRELYCEETPRGERFETL